VVISLNVNVRTDYRARAGTLQFAQYST